MRLQIWPPNVCSSVSPRGTRSWRDGPGRRTTPPGCWRNDSLAASRPAFNPSQGGDQSDADHHIKPQPSLDRRSAVERRCRGSSRAGERVAEFNVLGKPTSGRVIRHREWQRRNRRHRDDGAREPSICVDSRCHFGLFYAHITRRSVRPRGLIVEGHSEGGPRGSRTAFVADQYRTSGGSPRGNSNSVLDRSELRRRGDRSPLGRRPSRQKLAAGEPCGRSRPRGTRQRGRRPPAPIPMHRLGRALPGLGRHGRQRAPGPWSSR